MTAAASRGALGSEFDDFLFALIGENGNGMPLTIVSALGRMDVDPWHVAADLARLPAETAALKLVALLRALPDQLFEDSNRGALAKRLIALLPRPQISRAQADATLLEAGSPSGFRSRLTTNAVLFAVYMIVLLIYQFVSTRRDLPAHRESPPAATSLTTPSQTPPATSNR